MLTRVIVVIIVQYVHKLLYRIPETSMSITAQLKKKVKTLLFQVTHDLAHNHISILFVYTTIHARGPRFLYNIYCILDYMLLESPCLFMYP